MPSSLLSSVMVLCAGLQGSVNHMNPLPEWVDEDVAREYAEAALTELGTWIVRQLELSNLEQSPFVLAREGARGERVVQVVYPSERGSYYVVMAADRQNLLLIYSRISTMEQPCELVHRFYDPNFDPASLLNPDDI